MKHVAFIRNGHSRNIILAPTVDPRIQDLSRSRDCSCLNTRFYVLWMHLVRYIRMHYHCLNFPCLILFSYLSVRNNLFNCLASVSWGRWHGLLHSFATNGLLSFFGPFLLYGNAYSIKFMFSMIYVFRQSNLEPIIPLLLKKRPRQEYKHQEKSRMKDARELKTDLVALAI